MEDSSSSETVHEFLKVNLSTIEKAARVNEELKELLTELLDSGIKIPQYNPSAILNLKELEELRMFVAAIGEVKVPKNLCCPLSTKIMKDPVRLANGVTCDRPYIEKWLNNGKRTCPQTGEVLLNSSLSTDRATRKMILQWCKDQGIKPMADVDKAQDDERISFETMYTQKMLIKELDKKKGLIKMFSKSQVDMLLSLMSDAYDCNHPEVQVGVLEIISYLSHDNQMKQRQIIEKNKDVIPLLIRALQTGSLDIRTQAAKIINEILTIHPVKITLGQSNAIEALLSVLSDCTMPPNESLHAILKLFEIEENKTRAVNKGVVKVIINSILDENHLPEMLELLKTLLSIPTAVNEIVRLDSITYLMKIVRYRKPSYWDAVIILNLVCSWDPNQLSAIREEEQAYGTFSKLLMMGIRTEQVAAAKILEKLGLPHEFSYFL